MNQQRKALECIDEIRKMQGITEGQQLFAIHFLVEWQEGVDLVMQKTRALDQKPDDRDLLNAFCDLERDHAQYEQKLDEAEMAGAEAGEDPRGKLGPNEKPILQQQIVTM